MILPVQVAQNQFIHVPRQSLQTSKCFGCVSGYSGRGSESPTLKSETKGRRKRRKVLHANQQLREAEPWTVSSDVDFHGRKLGSTKSYLIGIRWHGLATIWKWREITPSAFLLHVILVHIRFIFILVFWHDSARAFDLFPRSSSILRRSVQDFAVITLWELQ